MLDLNTLFTRKTQSGNVAKDRLKLVLIHDRMNCSTELLEMMRIDVINAISKYVDIDIEDFMIEVSTIESEKDGQKSPVLSANIPIKNVKKVR